MIFREDCTCDEFIDVIMDNRVYMNCLYVSLYFIMVFAWLFDVVSGSI